MKRFFFNVFALVCLLALGTTLVLWARSYATLDEWHGWRLEAPAGLVHLYVQSNSGRVELYVSRARRVDAFNRSVAWPDRQMPNYPPTQYRSISPTRPEWGYADSFVPTPRANGGFNWAHEYRSEPADEVPTKYTWKITSYLNGSVTRREDRWLVAFPYAALAGLFAFPVLWEVLTPRKRKPVAGPGRGATTSVPPG